MTYGLLNVSVSLASGEPGRAEVLRLRSGDDVGAVDEAVHVLAKSRDGGEDELEVRGQFGLVVCSKECEYRIYPNLVGRKVTY